MFPLLQLNKNESHNGRRFRFFKSYNKIDMNNMAYWNNLDTTTNWFFKINME